MLNKDLLDRIQKRFPEGIFPAPFARKLDLDFIEFTEGRVTAEVHVHSDQCNPFGIAHGGFLFTLLDEILGSGASSVLDAPVYNDARALTTTNHEIYFHSPARPGDTLTIRSKVISARKSIIFMEGTIRRKGTDDLIATSKGMWYVIR